MDTILKRFLVVSCSVLVLLQLIVPIYAQDAQPSNYPPYGNMWYIQNGRLSVPNVQGNLMPVMLSGPTLPAAVSCELSDQLLNFPWYQNQSNRGSYVANDGYNLIRIPIDEFCYLNISNTTPMAFAGQPYITQVHELAFSTIKAGLAVVIYLAVSNPYSFDPTESSPDKTTNTFNNDHYQNGPVPNQDHSITLWTKLAAQFSNTAINVARTNYLGIIFDLYNRPNPIIIQSSGDSETYAWNCWGLGYDCEEQYSVASAQSLVNAIRAVDNTSISYAVPHIIVMQGIKGGTDLSQWLRVKPHDPAGLLIPGIYTDATPFTCYTTSCLDAIIESVAPYPIFWIINDNDHNNCWCDVSCGLLSFVFTAASNYSGIVSVGLWDATQNCDYGSIISDWYGTPTDSFGQQYMSTWSSTVSAAVTLAGTHLCNQTISGPNSYNCLA